ncbi:PREDICTED: uncharacterized protein LOC105112935 isoform X1 [Populus euphratica]|uniref:Uncharacterized protein LOC105112935 isoform X1 n=1 Tax=Populus euphratica TaxID=75702 RepID=A0AAJ6X6G3_POPEU|nr:PREDICTED: uncharacterized protein LOC105112935 isoform X1 [Populus euphratica]
MVNCYGWRAIHHLCFSQDYKSLSHSLRSSAPAAICMAANFKNTGILGKRVVNQIWTPNSARSFSASNTPFLSRGGHTSVYDKNPDDELRPNVVPDDVIKPQSDKYWAPHPRTGVFVPATEQHLSDISGGDSASVGDGGQDPVLEEKAWFRPTSLEDLEKPHRLN